MQTHVQSHGGGSGLAVPAVHELPAGMFPSYREYTELMQACWAKEPEQRPTFSEIVQRLRCSGSGGCPARGLWGA